MFECVAMIIEPECESGCFGDEKDASEKARNLSCLISIGWILILVSLWRFASWRVLFASIRVDIVAVLIALCKWLKRLERSGRVFTAAYCKDPIMALSSNFSSALMLRSICCFRSLLMWIGSIFVTDFSWESMMRLSCCCIISTPVKTKFWYFLEPNGKTASSFASCSEKYSSPPQSPSSTCIPITPEGVLEFSLYNKYTHGSNGEGTKESCLRTRSSSLNHKNGASIRPYADFSRRHISFSLSLIALASSGTGSNPIFRPSCVFPCKNAAFISKEVRVHLMEAISWSKSIRDWRPNVGLSLGIVSNSGSMYPNTTSRDFAFLVLFCLSCLALSSMGFHTCIHLHLSICSGERLDLRALLTVPVCSQLLTSDAFAFSNSSCSCMVKWLSFTSVLCFFWLVARRMRSSIWLVFSLWMSWGISNSKRQARLSLGSLARKASASVHVSMSHSSSSSVSGTGVSRAVLRAWWMFSSVGFSMSGSWSGCWLEILCGDDVISWLLFSTWSLIVISLWDRELIGSLCCLATLDSFWSVGVGIAADPVPSWDVAPCGFWSKLATSGHGYLISCASTALTGRTCSGATLTRFPKYKQNSDDRPSCWMTLAGPIHPFWFSLDLQNIIHSPGW